MRREARLYVLLARSTPAAVVFRRGPSKQVLLLRWNTATDKIEEGQWLKGRIYERRCDLSPEGEFLLYFAASYRGPYFSWTAISKPPWLTALAFWPKGDCWGGGGQFDTRSRIALNHREEQMALADGFKLPKSMTVRPFGKWPGRGEDDPIWSMRLERDGWTQVGDGRVIKHGLGAKMWIELDPPMVWEKRHPEMPERYTLQMRVTGIHERNGPWYLTEHRVFTNGEESHALGRSEWADWSMSGDLLFSKGGSLYRLDYARHLLAPRNEAREVANLTNLTFEARESPLKARRWKG